MSAKAPARKSPPPASLQSKAHYQPDIHRLLPQSPDAEMGLISSFLLAPVDIGDLCAERGIRPEHFHIPAHGTVYEQMRALREARKPIDFMRSLSER